MNKLKIIGLIAMLIVLLMNSGCEENPFDSPNPGRLTLHLKLMKGTYQNTVTAGDRLELVIQYIKGYVDSARWSYIVDRDSMKLINFLHVDNESNILTDAVIDTVWQDSATFQLDTVTVAEPLILSDSRGVYLPPLEYSFMKIKAVLQDTIMILGGKKYRIHQKEGVETITTVDLKLSINENEWLHQDLYFDLRSSIERSPSEPDHYYFHPKFLVQ